MFYANPDVTYDITGYAFNGIIYNYELNFVVIILKRLKNTGLYSCPMVISLL